MTTQEQIKSLRDSAKLCKQKAAQHKKSADKVLETARFWTEAADNAIKKADELEKTL